MDACIHEMRPGTIKSNGEKRTNPSRLPSDVLLQVGIRLAKKLLPVGHRLNAFGRDAFQFQTPRPDRREGDRFGVVQRFFGRGKSRMIDACQQADRLGRVHRRFGSCQWPCLPRDSAKAIGIQTERDLTERGQKPANEPLCGGALIPHPKQVDVGGPDLFHN